jgi:hypothetical protein
MTLTMRREGYYSDMNARQALLYSHKRLDVRADIGKGKERIPLGVASIVVCGEEEGEVISNVAVKAVKQDDQSHRAAFVGPKRKKIMSFDDDSFIYDLDESTTLRVGLQVIPRQNERIEPPKIHCGENLTDAKTILKLSDENFLLEKLKTNEIKDILWTKCRRNLQAYFQDSFVVYQFALVHLRMMISVTGSLGHH